MSRNEKEKAFQKHICKYLNTQHGYPVINQEDDVKDKEYYSLLVQMMIAIL